MCFQDELNTGVAPNVSYISETPPSTLTVSKQDGFLWYTFCYYKMNFYYVANMISEAQNKEFLTKPDLIISNLILKY